MKFLSAVSARLTEASTYAGISAICVAISTALAQDGAARYVALLGAVTTGFAAIAKAEHNPGVSAAMDQATQLVPVIAATIKAVQASYPAHQPPAS